MIFFLLEQFRIEVKNQKKKQKLDKKRKKKKKMKVSNHFFEIFFTLSIL